MMAFLPEEAPFTRKRSRAHTAASDDDGDENYINQGNRSSEFSEDNLVVLQTPAALAQHLTHLSAKLANPGSPSPTRVEMTGLMSSS